MGAGVCGETKVMAPIPKNPGTTEEECKTWEIKEAQYFKIMGMKRKDFDKTQVVKKYRKAFAKAQVR